MTEVLTAEQIAEKKRQRRTDILSYVFVGLMGLLGCAVAVFFLFSEADPAGVTVIAAVYVFTSGAAKLVAGASDVSDYAKDRLNLTAQALTLFGGSSGIIAIVSAVTS